MNLESGDLSWMELWRKGWDVPQEERWKWDFTRWDDVLLAIWEGQTVHLRCPICGQETVYFKYLAQYDVVVHGRREIHGQRWVGCEACGVQVHDSARIPDWLENPEWMKDYLEWAKRCCGKPR